LTLAEANVLLDDGELVSDLLKWWNGTIRKNARGITAADLRNARKLRDRHRLVRPTRPFPDLLTGLVAEPEAFAGRNLFVWVYEYGTFSDWVEGALDKARVEFHDSKLECWQDVEDPPPPGSRIIDFNSEYDPPRGPAIYKILDDQPTYEVSQGSLLLGKEVVDFDGMKVGDKKAWRAAAARAAIGGKTTAWNADDFAERFLTAAAS
jgi:hypothetical protein